MAMHNHKPPRKRGGITLEAVRLVTGATTHAERRALRRHVEESAEFGPTLVAALLDRLDELDPPLAETIPEVVLKVWREFADLRQKLAEADMHNRVTRNSVAEARDRVDRLFEATKRALK